jgi:hypothetical protein
MVGAAVPVRRTRSRMRWGKLPVTRGDARSPGIKCQVPLDVTLCLSAWQGHKWTPIVSLLYTADRKWQPFDGWDRWRPRGRPSPASMPAALSYAAAVVATRCGNGSALRSSASPSPGWPPSHCSLCWRTEGGVRAGRRSRAWRPAGVSSVKLIITLLALLFVIDTGVHDLGCRGHPLGFSALVVAGQLA